MNPFKTIRAAEGGDAVTDAERRALADWMCNCFYLLEHQEHFNSYGGDFFTSQMDGLDRSGQRRRNVFVVTFVSRRPLTVTIICSGDRYE